MKFFSTKKARFASIAGIASISASLLAQTAADPIFVEVTNDTPAVSITLDNASITGTVDQLGASIIVLPWNPYYDPITYEERHESWYDPSRPDEELYDPTYMKDVSVSLVNGSFISSNTGVAIDLSFDVGRSNNSKVTYPSAVSVSIDSTSKVDGGVSIYSKGGTATFINHGEITSTSGGTAFITAGALTSLSAENSGTVQGNFNLTAGTRLDFVNSGTIQNNGTALSVGKYEDSDGSGLSASVENSGAIKGSGNYSTVVLSMQGGTFEFVNDGSIVRTQNSFGPLSSIGDGHAALHVNSGAVGGIVINSGSIDSHGKAVLIQSGNVVLDLRQGTSIKGDIAFDNTEADITLKLNNTRLVGENKLVGMLAISQTGGASGFVDEGQRHIFQTSLITASDFGAIEASDIIYIEGVLLSLDLSSASFSIGDTFEILSSDVSVTGTFYGLDDGAEFEQNGYSFKITYTETSVILEALAIVPEASAYAAVLGLFALAFAVYRKRR